MIMILNEAQARAHHDASAYSGTSPLCQNGRSEMRRCAASQHRSCYSGNLSLEANVGSATSALASGPGGPDTPSKSLSRTAGIAPRAGPARRPACAFRADSLRQACMRVHASACECSSAQSPSLSASSGPHAPRARSAWHSAVAREMARSIDCQLRGGSRRPV